MNKLEKLFNPHYRRIRDIAAELADTIVICLEFPNMGGHDLRVEMILNRMFGSVPFSIQDENIKELEDDWISIFDALYSRKFKRAMKSYVARYNFMHRMSYINSYYLNVKVKEFLWDMSWYMSEHRKPNIGYVKAFINMLYNNHKPE